MSIADKRREIAAEVAEKYPYLPAAAQSELVDELLQVELDTKEVLEMAFKRTGLETRKSSL